MSGTGNTTTPGFYASQNGNPNTGWEENVVTNVGMDAAVLDNKLSFSVEWYKKSINGLLFTQRYLQLQEEPQLQPLTSGIYRILAGISP